MDKIDKDTEFTRPDDENNKTQKICYVCRRPESEVGKIMRMPGNMQVCPSCLQLAFDNINNINTVSNNKADNIRNIPFMNFDVSNINFEDINRLFSKNTGNEEEAKKEKKEKLSLTMADVPAPHKLKEMLDEYVIGQEKAKKIISVAVYNHYKRILHGSGKDKDTLKIEKSNILMLGPTGSGKTYLVKTLANILKVPLAIADATSLTEAGYIGDDIESVLSKLLSAADGDVDRAQSGIVFIDEIDKIAKKANTKSRDVSGESVQQELLKLLEGSKVDVPVGGNQKNVLTPMTSVNTDNILFICGGAFPDLEEIIKERLSNKSSMGFNSSLKEDIGKKEDLFSEVDTEDLRKFGMIPEFLGRLPIVASLSKLDEKALVKVLKEPKNAIVKQYIGLLEFDEVKLEFEDEALLRIAGKALEKGTGARALRAILEEIMLDIMYEVPKDSNISTVIVTKEYITGEGSPKIEFRSL